MKFLFCGTPEFAVPTLQLMLANQLCPEVVYTQPDRPRGRGQKVRPSPVKVLAEQAGLPVLQPERFNTPENLATLAQLEPDLAIVVAYAARIGPEALAIPNHGWLNLHPSLLPAYRGAAPMQWSLIRGETQTGLTTFFLNEAWDAGPICLQQPLSIDPGWNYADLSDYCAEQGAALVVESIRQIQSGQAPRLPQDDSQVSFAPLLKPADTILDWTQSAKQIHNRVRGLSPRPGAYAWLKEKRLQLLRTSVCTEPESSTSSPGTFLQTDRQAWRVATGQGVLEILELKPPNSKAMPAAAFLNGHPQTVGDRFEQPQ